VNHASASVPPATSSSPTVVPALSVRFHPRFAGGDEPVLRRMELVVSKWFSQCIHHTALGLPIDILGGDRPPAAAPNPSYLVAFSAFWLFAQQLSAVHDLYGRPAPELDQLVYDGLTDLVPPRRRCAGEADDLVNGRHHPQMVSNSA